MEPILTLLIGWQPNEKQDNQPKDNTSNER